MVFFKTSLSVIIISVIFLFGACIKEGPAGQDGEDGIDGEDGTAGCIQCHDDSQVIPGKSLQWEASLHATGGGFSNNSTECAPCHTSQGFLERMASDGQSTAETIQNANPTNCYTCHWIHKDYELTDWDLTYVNAVNLWHTTNSATSLDIGNGNLCANCHQAISPDPMPVPEGDSIEIASADWGLHFGPVANVIAANGGYEIGDGYGSSTHATEIENSCIVCHMAIPVGNKAGGHHMGMTYDDQGNSMINIAGCIECHENSEGLDLLIEATKDDINDLLTQLESILIDQQIMDSTYRAIPGKMSADQAGALLNFNMIRNDNSFGIHNYIYSRTLLSNSIASLQ